MLQAKAVQLAKAGSWRAATGARAEFQAYLANATGGANNEDVRRYTDYDWGYIEEYMNQPSTREWLQIPAHVPAYCVSSSSVRADSGCKQAHEHLYEDIMKPYTNELLAALRAGVRVLLYQGYFDLRDGVAATEAWLHNPSLARAWPPLHRFLVAERRPWRLANDPAGGVAGYKKRVGNLSQVVVVGSGHMVPIDQPFRAQQLMQGFFDGLL